MGQWDSQLLPPWFPQRGIIWKLWEKVWGSVSCTSTSDHTTQKAVSLSWGGWTCFSPLQAIQSCSGLPACTGVLSLWPGSASFLGESTRSFFLQKERCWVKNAVPNLGGSTQLGGRSFGPGCTEQPGTLQTWEDWPKAKKPH